MLFARALGKPSILIIGGYDIAKMPEIGYGHQRGGIKKLISRWTIRSATCLVTNSFYSQNEAVRNLQVLKEQVHVIYHGIPDPFGSLPGGPRVRMVLTVGDIDRSNLRRKGHESFVRAAALMEEVEFVLVGLWKDDAIQYLRSIATPNVKFTGRLSDGALCDYYQKASVYVQASLHEGFGMSVAEAMLAGCIPVTTNVGALPEVTGEYVVDVITPDPRIVARAIEKAFGYPQATRALIRQRILDKFPMEKRGRGLEQVINSLLSNVH